MGNLGDALRKAGFSAPSNPGPGPRDRSEPNRSRGGRRGRGRSGEQGNRPPRPAEDTSTRRTEPRRAPLTPVDLDAARATTELSEDQKNAARDLVRAHGSRKGLNGRRRWHYMASDRSLPHVNVEPEIASGLERGECALATDGSEIYLVDMKTAEILLHQDPTTLLFMNR